MIPKKDASKNMYDLANAMNRILRKVVRQAERQKTFGTYQRGASR